MLTIVGVMKDARQISARDRGIGVAYLSIWRYGRVTLAVRLARPSLARAASVRQQAHDAGAMRGAEALQLRASGSRPLLQLLPIVLGVLVWAT